MKRLWARVSAFELALVAARFVSVWLSKPRDELRTDLRSGEGLWLVVRGKYNPLRGSNPRPSATLLLS